MILPKIGHLIVSLALIVSGWLGYHQTTRFSPKSDSGVFGVSSGSGNFPTSTNNFQDGEYQDGIVCLCIHCLLALFDK